MLGTFPVHLQLRRVSSRGQQPITLCATESQADHFISNHKAACLLPDTPNPRQNHLLNALPAPERARIFPHLKLVEMPLGESVCEPGMTMNHVYFPNTTIVSLLYVMGNGASAEFAVVGNEGIVGVSLFMGAKPRLAGP